MTMPIRTRRPPPLSALALVLGAAFLAPACSPSRIVASSLGNALAEESLVYAGDDDVELIGAATPFGLKTMETLLTEVPRHRRLLTASARGFTQYAYVYVQLPADELEERDVAAAYEARARAKRLYLRARTYGLRALRLDDDESRERLRSDPRATIVKVRKKDLEALYWTAIAWSAAIALGKDDPELVAGLPIVDAMIARVVALDPDFDDGGLHTFLISWEMARPGAAEKAADVALGHFRRAVELSAGDRVAPFVAMAESVSVSRNQRRAFEDYLTRAIAIDADARAEWRLANHVMQRRALWLLARTDLYFLE